MSAGAAAAMRTRLEELYPPAAWQLPVSPALPAPHRPNPPPELTRAGGYREHYGPFILREFDLGDGARIAAIDKAFPHALYDLMLLDASERAHAHVAAAPAAVTGFLLRAARAFAAFTANRRGLADCAISAGWNYDPTRDRDNGQWWDKRLHLHLNCWPRRTLARARVLTLREIADPGLRRSLIDPIAYLAHQVMLDALAGTQIIPEHLAVLRPDPARDRAGSLPTGLKILLPSWEAVADPTTGRMLAALHRRAQHAYDAVRIAFTGSPEPPGPWQRPELRSAEDAGAGLDAIGWLVPETRAGLMGLRRALRNLTPRELELLRRCPHLANRFLTLEQLSYNMTLIPDPRGVLLVMQFKLISYIGSSPALGGAVASVIDRTGGPVLTARAARARCAFQTDFLDTLEHL